MSTPRQRSLDLRNDTGLLRAADVDERTRIRSDGGDADRYDAEFDLRRIHSGGSKNRRRLGVEENHTASSTEVRESFDDEEGEMEIPLHGELNSSVGPKNLLSLFDSVSDDE